MDLLTKRTKLADLISEEVAFALKEHKNDWFGKDIISLKIPFQDVTSLGLSSEDWRKILDKWQEGEVIEHYFDAGGDYLEVGIPALLAPFFKDASEGIKFIFDHDSGYGFFGGKKTDFGIDTNQYAFVDLLASNRGKVFTYDQIYQAVWKPNKDSFSKGDKKKVQDMVNGIKKKLQKDGIPEYIFEANGGYRLK